VDNHKQVDSYNSKNIWDNGWEGNYWSDYTGKDRNGDEIGDTPYVIDENNRDNYPIMNPWTLEEEEEEEVPFWTQWWLWTIVIAVIAVLAVDAYFLKKRKPPKPTAPTLPIEGPLISANPAFSLGGDVPILRKFL